MNVVIDSNIIISGYNLRNPAFFAFVKYFPEKNIQVWVSEVTVEEVFKNHLLDLKETVRVMNKAKSDLNKLSTEVVKKLPNEFIEEEHARYKDYFVGKLKDNGIRVLKIPDIDHREIIRYSVTGRKPFDAKDNGYKDFLIWRSCVEMLKSNSRDLVILTKDSDFLDKKELSADLVKDLEENGIKPSRVSVHSSFNTFNDEHLKDVYKIVEVKEAFQTYEALDLIQDSVKETVLTDLTVSELEKRGFRFRPEFEDITIRHSELLDAPLIDNVEVLNETTINADFRVRVHMSLDFYVYKHDLYSIPDDEQPGIEDGDWNEWYVWASEELEFDVVGAATFDDEVQMYGFEIRHLEQK